MLRPLLSDGDIRRAGERRWLRGSMDAVPLLILALVVAVVALGQFAVWVVLVQLIQQQGRMLVRLDNLAEASATLGDRLPVIAASPQPGGRPVGVPVGGFTV